MFAPTTKVLVVDDMRTMRKLVIGALATANLKTVVEAENGQDALAQVEKAHAEGAPFGLIVSDWNMPVMTGIDFLKKVRAHAEPNVKKTPFLMVTAEAEQKNIIEAVQAGVNNYIIKPFTPAQILDKLTAIYAKVSKG